MNDESTSDSGPDATTWARPQGLEGRMLGNFRIVRKPGEGGKGVVYEAEQQHPKRPDRGGGAASSARPRDSREGDGNESTGERVAPTKSSDDPAMNVALAQLPGRLRRARRLFHDLTGLTAVTSIRGAVEDPRDLGAIAPPIHPRCASLLRTTKQEAPCEKEWRRHLRIGLRSRDVQSHVCSLGLRCSCVPIYCGETLVGIAKFVADPKTTDRQVSLAVRALEMAVSKVSQDFYISTLSEELNELRWQVAELRKVHGRTDPEVGEGAASDRALPKRAPTAHPGSRVEEVLEYVHGHYLDPNLSLVTVSRALGLSDKYLTHLFTQVVGERMRAYIVQLRLQHSCRQLLTTGMPIKQIAYASGFRQPDRLRHAFRKQVGVAPSRYRRTFARA